MRIYQILFAANVLALISTGIVVIALSLFAFDLAGEDAGAVIGVALSIKMLAFTLAPPFAASYAEKLRVRDVLIWLDLIRAGAILALPLANSIWFLYGLVAVFSLCSAAFVTLYQRSIGQLLTDPADYAWAHAKSRIAYELEGAMSPLFATALLLFLDFRGVFVITAVGFLASAFLVTAVEVPRVPARVGKSEPHYAWPSLRKLVSHSPFRGVAWLVACSGIASAVVMTGTVVIVSEDLKLGARETAFAFAAFGFGSILAAVGLPRLIARFDERSLMLTGAGMAAAGLAAAAFQPRYEGLLIIWICTGIGVGLAQLPAPSLLRRLSQPEELPYLLAALLTVTNASLLISYPLTGWLGAAFGTRMSLAVLAAVATFFGLIAIAVWRSASGRSNPERLSQ